MYRRFRDLSIALKLNVLLGLMTFVVVAMATVWVVSSVRQQLERQAMQELEKTNTLALSMFEAYYRSLSNDVERSSRLFASIFDGPLELVKSDGSVPLLMLRGKALNTQVDQVDAFSAKSGTVATVFVRQGDNFVRTATSVKKDDGSRV
ncbi:MAG: Cache 3/Cache 2 fusion domain-containing protein, partial [Deltaproteobacteria bacterium]|nr:Cache 3/Cache 2 fusion domain-containing protein [Deltaproteobacteria bacterium]